LARYDWNGCQTGIGGAIVQADVESMIFKLAKLDDSVIERKSLTPIELGMLRQAEFAAGRTLVIGIWL